MKGMLERKRQFLEYGTLKIDPEQIKRNEMEAIQKKQLDKIEAIKKAAG